ncbi:MAG: zf-HC2 domain-containing protein [Candidatus Cloacimonas sp.]
MKCSKAKRYLLKQIDGELDIRFQAKLLSHLDKCPACKAFLADAQKMQRKLSALPEAEFPAWVHNQIMAKVHQLETKNPGFARRVKLIPVTAMLAITLSLWAGIKIGVGSYKNIIPKNQDYSISTSIAYGSFGENTILDDVTENGE